MYSMVYHLLAQRDLKNSLSVFIAECGFERKSFLLSELDIVAALHISTTSAIYKKIMDKELGVGTAHQQHDGSKENDGHSNRNSILDHVASTFMDAEHKQVDMAVQTEGFGIGAMESLDMQVKDLRQSYLSRLDAERLSPSRTVEERMILFQRDCEERFRRDLAIQVTYIRENETAKVRLEESRKARLDLDTVRQQMESDYQKKLQSRAEHESELNRSATEKERQLQQSLYEARQFMQREIDDLRSREQAYTRKLELEGQGLRVLELRLKESQTVLDGRERELCHRELDAENKTKGNMERAREEARAQLQAELAVVIRDRSALIVDRQRLEEDRASQRAVVDNANAARTQMRELQTLIMDRDDEITLLKLREKRMDVVRKDEDMQVAEVPRLSMMLVCLCLCACTIPLIPVPCFGAFIICVYIRVYAHVCMHYYIV
jgi:hypothetical protein